MYVFPGELHNKWQPAHRLAVYTRNIDWFDFWLRGYVDPDPSKSEQYERWRALRALVDEEPATGTAGPCSARLAPCPHLGAEQLHDASEIVPTRGRRIVEDRKITR